jgi:hypothetical protein
MRAHLNTSSAAGTAGSIEHNFRVITLRLRVGTPQATQGTTLQENGRPYTGTVMDGIVLDVEDYSTESFHRM